MFPWDILLSATLEAGLSLLVEVGFGDEARALKEGPTGRDEKARLSRLEIASPRRTRLAMTDRRCHSCERVAGRQGPTQNDNPQKDCALLP